MKSRITMKDVARAAGVSSMTVSRALRDDSSVNAATRAQVRETAAQLGYVYDTTAQAFRAQRSGFVAVTMPSINNANFATTYRALRDGLVGTDLQILLGITDYRIQEEERLIQQLLARRPEALVLTGGTHTDGTRQLVKAAAIPVVEMWDLPPQPIGDVVGFSNAEAMALIVTHLADQGCKKLGFLGATLGTDRRGDDRRLGVIAAAQKLGLSEVTIFECGPAPVSMRDGSRAVTGAGQAMRELDGLVCVSDPVAFGALSACVGLGLTVPTDIAITGFGAFEIASVSHPTLTTVDVGAEAIGSHVAQTVITALTEDPNPETQVHALGATLLRGQST